MATLAFAATDRKVFTPISSTLANLQNGPGTMVVLVKKSATSNADYVGLTDSGPANWYGSVNHDLTDNLRCDRNHVYSQAATSATDDTTNWWLYAADWAGGGVAALDRFHWRNQTALGSWTHQPSGANGSAAAAGPGTSGWLRLGYNNDESGAGKSIAVVAIWAGVRFADADYSTAWDRTSDLYNHAAGIPSFLCELTATTLVDLTGGSTYSSANGVGTTLTGADPDNWTLDGVGPANPQVNAIRDDFEPSRIGPF